MVAGILAPDQRRTAPQHGRDNEQPDRNLERCCTRHGFWRRLVWRRGEHDRAAILGFSAGNGAADDNQRDAVNQ